MHAGLVVMLLLAGGCNCFSSDTPTSVQVFADLSPVVLCDPPDSYAVRLRELSYVGSAECSTSDDIGAINGRTVVVPVSDAGQRATQAELLVAPSTLITTVRQQSQRALSAAEESSVPLQAKLDVSGGNVVPWSPRLQTAVVAFVAGIAGSEQITVAGRWVLNPESGRRLLQAQQPVVRLALDIGTTAAAAAEVFHALEGLYTADTTQRSLHASGFGNVTVYLRSLASLPSDSLQQDIHAWRTRFIVATAVLAVAVAIMAVILLLGVTRHNRALVCQPCTCCLGGKEPEGSVHLKQRWYQRPPCMHPSMCTSDSPNKSSCAPAPALAKDAVVHAPESAGKQVVPFSAEHLTPRASGGGTCPPINSAACEGARPPSDGAPAAEGLPRALEEHSPASTAPAASEAAAAIGNALSGASASARPGVPPLIRSIPAGLPEDVQKCYVDFMNLWNADQGENPWMRPSSMEHTSPIDQQGSVPASMGQTPSESEPFMSPAASIGVLLTRHPDWELQLNDIILCCQADGQPEIVSSAEHCTTFKAMLRGSVPVAVQVPDFATDTFTFEVLVEVAVQLKELNSCPSMPFFHGIVLAEKPMLVFEFLQDGLRHLIMEAADQPLWYGRGKQLALQLACALDFFHSRDLMLLGSLTSKRVQLDVSGTAKLDSVGINLLLLKGHKCRRQDICPLDWTPPELLLGRRCGLSADVFQYAILLWELITRDVPLRGAVRPVAAPEECPGAIASLIARCMARDPASRPTCSQIIATIREYWDCMPPPGPSASAGSASDAASWPWATLGDQISPSARSSSLGDTIVPSVRSSVGDALSSGMRLFRQRSDSSTRSAPQASAASQSDVRRTSMRRKSSSAALAQASLPASEQEPSSSPVAQPESPSVPEPQGTPPGQGRHRRGSKRPRKGKARGSTDTAPSPAHVQQRRDGLDSAYAGSANAAGSSPAPVRPQGGPQGGRKAKHRVLDSAQSVSGCSTLSSPPIVPHLDLSRVPKQPIEPEIARVSGSRWAPLF